ncbi:uncharacterized protein LOC18108640 isoform X1 [Populus trichocarpa]|uniref:uncharacterized protein LOC18108640 isoform X1 n=1 Tax=Populus trichocarpa TaxID=3694 RepID=UPI000D1880F4|nr:uncharacterized protein LOC18108640 isoform X1 [Populus trichocarpa]XP_052305366.1 uncharacterized protein LOC18108640 isoform X1 [Populus trichocarpa]XP_052305367.1 uncharacterized protein LOC18108640 isoform X1 [Populus trichocarpa]|eukprot:XP_024447094.1 uncharacterized protein LOC18108640 isoform X1 [Populus trichocarpa]
MAGNLVKEDSSSVQDLQDPRITSAHAYTFKHAGSGHKRKKSTPEINKDYRERKKEEVEKLKAETEELKKSKFHLDGQAFQLRMDLKETREENINLKIVEKSQSDSILEIGKKLIALGEHHPKEIRALKEEHAQKMLERDRELNALKEELERQMQLCSSWHIDMGTENAGEMIMQH